jgi:catechol 2,3-dioxygenase-like lactoylglutathione lyase family enzyme
MNTAQASSKSATVAPEKPRADLKLEVIVIPVADANRAMGFYGGLGWRLDADVVIGEDFRVVQFTPRLAVLGHLRTGSARRAHRSRRGGERAVP